MTGPHTCQASLHALGQDNAALEARFEAEATKQGLEWVNEECVLKV
jgi:hypothetical protein